MGLRIGFVFGIVLGSFVPAFSLVPPSREVHADRTITFRYSGPLAKSVSLQMDTIPQPLAMQRDDAGTWSVTTPPMPPDIYGYNFVVDGVRIPDPRDPEMRPNFQTPTTEVTVPGASPEAWELAAIPHGRVDLHHFTTHIARNMPAGQDAYVVYTPPAYDAKKKSGYPVLYLLHGFTDNEEGWTAVGRAHLILDRLIADGKAVPMIVVMPLGYGNFSYVTGEVPAANRHAASEENVDLFEKTLLEEIGPAVEREYRVAHGRDRHAIVGLSMGGQESLTIGLRHPDLFAYVGGFSSGLQGTTFDDRMSPPPGSKLETLRLLWVACGVDDRLITPNRAFVSWAKAKGLPVTPVETEGSHQWPVWRKNLIAFTPLLFR